MAMFDGDMKTGIYLGHCMEKCGEALRSVRVNTVKTRLTTHKRKYQKFQSGTARASVGSPTEETEGDLGQGPSDAG